jgi:2-oxoglutarate dehydrogenase E2 component (dihydrolipoamide succinyltransferase)
MALVEMVMPKMGESIMEGTILNWLKKVGDKIEQDESVLEVATDKVDTEVPAIHGGILKEILAKQGDVVQVGKPIAIIETDANTKEESLVSVKEADEILTSQPTDNLNHQASKEVEFQPARLIQPITGRFYSPLVLNIAKTENISREELDCIPGTGKDNRVTKKDILAYVQHRPENASMGEGTQSLIVPNIKVSPSISAQDEIIEMDRMRKMIAERMLASKRISPHVTSFVEADMTSIAMWRNKYKYEFKNKYNGSLTFTPIFIEAVAKAIKDYPMINISVDGDKIIKKKDINIGMAVALPNGNLIVPVIKNADMLNLGGLALKVNDLAKRARENKLTADELSGGTYTISNVGSFGNVMGTPIIMQPQVGIMAFGTVVKKPAVIETPLGDTIGIRHKMFLSHSYDHRVIDGSLGGMFVRRVADYLEKFDTSRAI